MDPHLCYHLVKAWLAGLNLLYLNEKLIILMEKGCGPALKLSCSSWAKMLEKLSFSEAWSLPCTDLNYMILGCKQTQRCNGNGKIRMFVIWPRVIIMIVEMIILCVKLTNLEQDTERSPARVTLNQMKGRLSSPYVASLLWEQQLICDETTSREWVRA